MSFQYDQYLARHRANVKRGFDWLSKNLPGLMTNTLTAGWNTEFAHDQSKNEPDEYEAYDAYFYGNNRSYEVVQRYQRAWLLHIHRNDFMVGSLSEEILNMTVTGIENDENIENTVVVYVTDEED